MGKVYAFEKGSRGASHARKTPQRPREAAGPLVPCPSESRLKEAVLDRLAWDRNVLAFSNAQDNRHNVKTGLGPGSADIICCLAPLGRWAALEVKQPGEKATDDQKVWLAQIRRTGGFAAVVCSVEEAEQAIKRAQSGQLG